MLFLSLFPHIEHGSENFENFLKLLGDKINLRGFSGYCGGLDNKRGDTGKESIHTHWKNDFEVMFHVQTYLPFNPTDKQQIQRKKHIGNGKKLA